MIVIMYSRSYSDEAVLFIEYPHALPQAVMNTSRLGLLDELSTVLHRGTSTSDRMVSPRYVR